MALVIEKSQGPRTSLPPAVFSLSKGVSLSYYSHCPIFSSPAHSNIIPHLQEMRKEEGSLL